MSAPDKHAPAADQPNSERSARTENDAGAAASRPSGTERVADKQRAALVFGLLLLVLLGMVNYIGARHYQRWDWTHDAHFTLSPRTVEVIRALPVDVTLYLFIDEGVRGGADALTLAQLYEDESARIEVEQVEPRRDPTRYMTLADRYGLPRGPDGGEPVGALLVAGDRSWKIAEADLLPVGSGGPGVSIETEQALTGGLLELTAGEPTRVCATVGHGELSPHEGLSGLRSALVRENVELETIDTRNLSRVPERCDVVLVAAPQRPVEEAWASRLVAWAEGGGALWLLADVFVDRGSVMPTGFEAPLARLGIELDTAVLAEMSPNFLLDGQPMGPVLYQDLGEHPATQSARALQSRVMMSLTRTVRAGSAGVGEVTELVRASEASFADVDIADVYDGGAIERRAEDIRGPVAVAVAWEGDAREGDEPGRISVVGDAEWLAPELLQQRELNNAEFAMGLVGWLTQRQALVELDARESGMEPLVISDGDLDGIFLRVVVMLPLAFALFGFSVFWERRR